MRKIRIFAYTSLDGVLQPPGDDAEAQGGWMTPYRSAAGAEAVAEAQGKHFDLLLGRRTYDMWAGYWPKFTGGPFADTMNGATKYVATHRPTGLDWGPVEAIGPDITESVRRVRSTAGGPARHWEYDAHAGAV